MDLHGKAYDAAETAAVELLCTIIRQQSGCQWLSLRLQRPGAAPLRIEEGRPPGTACLGTDSEQASGNCFERRFQLAQGLGRLRLLHSSTPEEWSPEAETLIRGLTRLLDRELELSTRLGLSLNKESLLEAVLNSAETGLLVLDYSGRILRSNRKLAEMTGYSVDELSGQGIELLLPQETPGPVQRQLRAYLDGAINRKHLPSEQVVRTTQGRLLPVWVTYARVELAGSGPCLVTTIQDLAPLRAAERAVQESEARFRAFFENSMDAALITEPGGSILHANPAAETLFGYSEAELCAGGRSLVFIEDDENFLKALDARRERGFWRGELPLRRRNGESFPGDVVCTRYLDSSGRERTSLVLRDITEKKRAQDALQAIATGTASGSGEEFFRLIARQLATALGARYALVGELFEGTRPQLKSLAFWDGREFRSTITYELSHSPLAMNTGRETVHIGREVARHYPEDALLQTLSAESYTALPLCDPDDNVLGFLVVIDDRPMAEEQSGEIRNILSIFAARVETELERIRAQEALSYEASHDHLTNLLNRRAFDRRLRALTRAEQAGTEHALLYIDLDRFKIVNDSCGHVAGDDMLRQVAGVMSQCVRGSDYLARLGGDEFGVLLQNCSRDKALHLSKKILEALRHFQFRVEDRHFDVGASIGLVHFSGGEESSAELLRQADLACYAAKESGRNQVRVYDADDQLLRVRHQEIGWFERLRHALKEGRFLLFGQRIIPLNQEGQARREVLLRMRNEEGELILPQDFILTAERYEIMPDLDRWVIDRVLRHLADGLCTGEMLSINLSGLTLDDSELFSFIRQSCRHYGIKGERLAFEITETAAMTHYARANALFRELRQLGCEIHLDDFGSGLSSFGYLRNMQFDCLKIDGSFIRKLDKNPEDRAMVEAMQRIGQTMGMQTVAEFVERPELLAPLREIGIHRAQGFALHRPEPL